MDESRERQPDLDTRLKWAGRNMPLTVVSAHHVTRLADGKLMNVGHTGDEIQIDALGSRRSVIPFVEEARVGGSRAAGGQRLIAGSLIPGSRSALN